VESVEQRAERIAVLEQRRGRAAPTERRSLSVVPEPGWMAGPPTASGMSVTPHTALRIVDVLACVRLLSESAACCPLVSYVRRGEARQRSTTALHDLLDRPAPAMTQAALVGATVGALALRGNAFLGKFRDYSGRVAQLAPLSNDLVSVSLAGPGGEPRYTLVSGAGVSEHGSEDILHIRGALSVDGIHGVSPVGLAREALGLASALTATSAALFDNQAVPKGILTVPAGDAEDDVLESLREGFTARHGGPQNAGRVAVLSSDVKFTGVSLSPADAELLAMRKLSSTEIARLFRVPPALLGMESGSSLTYTSTEMAGIDFLRFSLQPLLTVIEQAVTHDPDLSGPDEFCEFLADSFLRADSATRATVYSQGIAAGWLEVNDVRRAENLAPLPAPSPLPAALPPTETPAHA